MQTVIAVTYETVTSELVQISSHLLRANRRVLTVESNNATKHTI